MYPKATIVCSCGCMFESNFQKSSLDNPPRCPQCGTVMDESSWKSLRTTMAEFADFNQHILKWNYERNEPKMIVPVITVSTLED